MLTVTNVTGNNQYAAANYFSAADDYYAKENPGLWFGKGAEELGLVGAIERKEFARLLNGQLPNKEQIKASIDPANKKRMGLDLTFSAPKSVSMQALVAGDLAVTNAHDVAIDKALQQIEVLAQARKKVNGKSHKERTSNMVIGKFRHEMSRAKDPQLHTHSIVLNMTKRSDGKWRALSNDDIFQTRQEADAIYKAELAKELQRLGYSIRTSDAIGNFELAHISREQIEAFSSRSKAIEDVLASKGLTRATSTGLEKQIISLATRPDKEALDKNDRELIKQYWVQTSRDFNIDYGNRSKLDERTYNNIPEYEGTDALSLPASLTPAQAVVQYAINHLTEREAVVSKSKLIETAMNRAVGLAGYDEVAQEITKLTAQGTLIESTPTYHLVSDPKQSLSIDGWKHYLQELKGWTNQQSKQYVENAVKQGSLVPTEKRYTTQKALKREKAILAIERDGRSKLEPILDATIVKGAMESSTLNAGQREAVEAMVSSKNRFVGIQGDAGTGKTYAINYAVELIKQSQIDIRTVALAPYGNQVKAFKNEGLEAHTVASFLYTKNNPIDDKTLLVLDESGVVGARQMEQLMRLVEKSGARMVMLGDTKQTEAIEAGKPFAQLQTAGMQTARINEIQRQKDPELKIAVEHAAEARINSSIQHIKHIEEIEDSMQRHKTIVADYINLPEAEKQDTLIIAGTNAARKEINAIVRDSLNLTGNGKQLDTLTRVDMTNAQRRFAPAYQAGMLIQAEKDYAKAGLLRGETYLVKEALAGNLLALQRADGSELSINPRKVTRLSIYHLEKNELSVGDLVRINRNDAKLDLTNGDRMRVTGITGFLRLESIEKKDGKPARSIELSPNKPLHLEHAYASTVHGSQGLTNNRVFVSLDTKSRTTSMNLYYVAISRARYEARIYTNSAKDLPSAVARRFDKTTALDIQRQRQYQNVQPKTPASGIALQRTSLEKQPPEFSKKQSGMGLGY